MTITKHTLDGRRAAEKIMTTRVEIGTLEDATDPVTLDAIVVVVPVWAGKARIFTQSVAASAVEGPSMAFLKQKLMLSLPVTGTEIVSTGMSVRVTHNPADESLVGVFFAIRGVSGASNQTARRFEIERNS